MKKIFFIVMAFLVFVNGKAMAGGKTEIHWYGHSAYKITTPAGKIILIDPWITNPSNKTGKDDVEHIEKADLILLTHGHNDHIGNTVQIAQKTGARLVATFDLAKAMIAYRGFPKEQATMETMGHMGGEITLLGGEVKVLFVNALHGSAVEAGEDGKFSGQIGYGGNPGGFVITVKNGPVIYHTGDTDVFSDMSLIGKFKKIDIMLACIGDKFTMGPDRAAYAVKLVNPKIAIPNHYGTFPALTGTPEAFSKALKKEAPNVKMFEMKAGEKLEF